MGFHTELLLFRYGYCEINRSLAAKSVLSISVLKPIANKPNQNSCIRFLTTSLVVLWSELLTTKHEIPGSIPGSTMGIFPCRGRIPLVTMVWVVSKIRLKVETSVTRSHNSINSD